MDQKIEIGFTKEFILKMDFDFKKNKNFYFISDPS